MLWEAQINESSLPEFGKRTGKWDEYYMQFTSGVTLNNSSALCCDDLLTSLPLFSMVMAQRLLVC